MNIHIPIAQLKKKKRTITFKCLVRSLTPNCLPVPPSRVNHPSFGVSCIILVSFKKKKTKREKKETNRFKCNETGCKWGKWLGVAEVQVFRSLEKKHKYNIVFIK